MLGEAKHKIFTDLIQKASKEELFWMNDYITKLFIMNTLNVSLFIKRAEEYQTKEFIINIFRSLFIKLLIIYIILK